MASLLDAPASHGEPVRLLDPGAGIGSLTAAVAQRLWPHRVEATCYEAEPHFQDELHLTLAGLPDVIGKIEAHDFIAHAAELVRARNEPGYTHAILNPPYKKIGRSAPARQHLRALGLETSNLYAGFLACAVALCQPDAQVVAILPRSFMNGLYFKPFRRWLLARVAISQITVFDRRNSAFAGDQVLQENVILKVVVGGRQEQVTVTAFSDASLTEMRRRLCAFSEIVSPGDAEHFIHIPGATSQQSQGGSTLSELGLDISTGPVVDFRQREHLRMQPEPGAVPLLYPRVRGWPPSGTRLGWQDGDEADRPPISMPHQNLALPEHNCCSEAGHFPEVGNLGELAKHHTGEIEGLRRYNRHAGRVRERARSCQLKWIGFIHANPEAERSRHRPGRGCRWRRTHQGWRCRCAGTIRGCGSRAPRCDRASRAGTRWSRR